MNKTKQALLAGMILTGMSLGGAGEAEARDGICREYSEHIRISGRIEDAYGTACLQGDGSWKITVAAKPDSSRSRDLNRDRDYADARREVVYYDHSPRVIYVYDRAPRYGYYYPPGLWKKRYTHYDRHQHRDRHENRHDRRYH
ncbi:MAG: hypothetical protein H6868_04925 [Rhodospirillales bacterium]|nr:hypothetical protein [Rhodospirillales bacterium]